MLVVFSDNESIVKETGRLVYAISEVPGFEDADANFEDALRSNELADELDCESKANDTQAKLAPEPLGTELLVITIDDCDRNEAVCNFDNELTLEEITIDFDRERPLNTECEYEYSEAPVSEITNAE